MHVRHCTTVLSIRTKYIVDASWLLHREWSHPHCTCPAVDIMEQGRGPSADHDVPPLAQTVSLSSPIMDFKPVCAHASVCVCVCASWVCMHTYVCHTCQICSCCHKPHCHYPPYCGNCSSYSRHSCRVWLVWKFHKTEKEKWQMFLPLRASNMYWLHHLNFIFLSTFPSRQSQQLNLWLDALQMKCKRCGGACRRRPLFSFKQHAFNQSALTSALSPSLM